MIEPTLSLDQARARRWDVVVVGAGPAGSLAAVGLARGGASVLLVDRAAFPRAKVCGCCLNRRALAALDAAGLADLPTAAGAVPLRSLHLAAGRQAAQLPVPGLALSRTALDGRLVRAAVARGADFLPSTCAALGPVTEEVRQVHLRQGTTEGEVVARVVLAADGLGGLLLGRGQVASAPPRPGSRIGAGVLIQTAEAFYAPGIVFMTVGPAGYLGLVRVEDGRLDLACAVDAAAVRAAGGPGALAAELLAAAGWPVPAGLAAQPWRGTPPLTRRADRVADQRLFALGDATGYVEPFTGEGLAWAMASAVALAPLALRASRCWQPALVREWNTLHRRLVTRRQFVCRWLAAALRRPWLWRAPLAVLDCFPWLARPLLSYLNDV
jgi:flavin-dependent dehydrogenase